MKYGNFGNMILYKKISKTMKDKWKDPEYRKRQSKLISEGWKKKNKRKLNEYKKSVKPKEENREGRDRDTGINQDQKEGSKNSMSDKNIDTVRGEIKDNELIFVGGNKYMSNKDIKEESYQCSECGNVFNGTPAHCPNCGSKLLWDES